MELNILFYNRHCFTILTALLTCINTQEPHLQINLVIVLCHTYNKYTTINPFPRPTETLNSRTSKKKSNFCTLPFTFKQQELPLDILVK